MNIYEQVVPHLAGRAAEMAAEDEKCPQCHRYDHPGHECCVCLDGGRVVLDVPMRDRRFGIAQPCPACVGERDGQNVQAAYTADEFARRSRIPAMFASARFSNWEPARYGAGGAEIRDQVRRWGVQWPPRQPFLVLVGNRGNGKTHLAAAVLQEVFDRHAVLGQFWHARDVVARLQATYDAERATETIADARAFFAERLPLLVIDDLGAEKNTEYAVTELGRIVDERYSNQRPLVVTFNAGSVEERTNSRLLDRSRSLVVAFDGRDQRLSA